MVLMPRADFPKLIHPLQSHELTSPDSHFQTPYNTIFSVKEITVKCFSILTPFLISHYTSHERQNNNVEQMHCSFPGVTVTMQKTK